MELKESKLNKSKSLQFDCEVELHDNLIFISDDRQIDDYIAEALKPLSNAPIANMRAAFDNHFEDVFAKNANKRSVFAR